MKKLEWKQEYGTGNSKMDFEHQILLNLLSNLYSVSKVSVDTTFLQNQIDVVELFVLFHFKSEENLMSQINYPNYNEHKEAHQEAQNKITKAKEQCATEEDLHHLVIAIFDWFIEHNTEHDCKLEEYISGVYNKSQEAKHFVDHPIYCVEYNYLLSGVLNDFDAAIFILNNNNNIIWLNNVAITYFKLQNEEVIHSNIIDVFNTMDTIIIDKNAYVDKIKDAYKHNRLLYDISLEIISPDTKSKRILEYTGKTINEGIYKGGRIEYYRDVTEKVAINNKIQGQKEYLASLFLSITELILVIDKYGIITDHNMDGKNIDAYSFQNLRKNEHIADTFPPDVHQLINTKIKQLQHSKTEQVFEYSLMIGRQRFWYNAKLTFYNNKYDEFIGYIMLIRNITNDKNKEAVLNKSLQKEKEIKQQNHNKELALRESEAMFATIFRNSPTALILERKEDGLIFDLNKCFTTLFGYDKVFASGKTTFEIGLWECFEQRDDLLSSISSMETQFKKAVFKNNKGEALKTNLSVVVIKNRNIEFILTQIIDISKETAIQELMQIRKNELKKSLEEKEVLLKEVHHRVKNNLQVVSGLINKQKKYTSDPYTIAVLDDSLNRIRSMAAIHEQIYKNKSLSQINLFDYVHELTYNLFRTLQRRGQNIELIIHIDNIYISLDKSVPVALILNELITNALKYAFADKTEGAITITAINADKKTRLQIKDNGVGLPADFNIKNTGSLGMYLVYNLATKQLDGSLDVDNTNGAAFTICFKNNLAV